MNPIKTEIINEVAKEYWHMNYVQRILGLIYDLNIRTFLQESLKEIIKSKCFRYSNKMQIR
jgi:hypothetical protein